MADRWLSVDEIAEHLGVSKDTVYTWVNERGILGHRSVGCGSLRLMRWMTGCVRAVQAASSTQTNLRGNHEAKTKKNKTLWQESGARSERMLTTVRDGCTLQPSALEIRISDQIEQLDELIRSEGDGTAYFSKTHITNGMESLVREGIARLAGKSTTPVFHLKQAMGGGKTHLLVGFGLLAKNKSLRHAQVPAMKHLDAFDSAKVAAFNGRNSPEHYLWGEIAAQLGSAEQFKKFWTSGPKAPDEQDWLTLFGDDEPVLILLDEMPPYFHYLDTQKVGNGTVADIATRAFSNMLTAAGKKSNVCIVVSDLDASYATGQKLINRALTDARHELGRQERNITPVDLAGNEIYAILRKRLFKTLPNEESINTIADRFGQELTEATKAKVANRGAEAIADEVIETYPFHPQFKNLVALFKENENFMQTRGLMVGITVLSRLGATNERCLSNRPPALRSVH